LHSHDHENLTGLQGGAAGDHKHLTAAQHTALTGGGDASGQHHHDGRYLLRTAGDFVTFPEKLIAADDDIVLIEDSEDTDNKKKMKVSEFLKGITQFTNRVFYPGTVTSTVNVDTLIPGMTLTPAAGKYLAFVGGAINSSVKSRSMYINVYAGGVVVPGSEIEFDPAEPSVSSPFAMVAIEIDVNGSQAIEIRWRVDSGSPPAVMSFINRTFTLMQVIGG
jgi:hypothetical protein